MGDDDDFAVWRSTRHRTRWHEMHSNEIIDMTGITTRRSIYSIDPICARTKVCRCILKHVVGGFIFPKPLFRLISFSVLCARDQTSNHHHHRAASPNKRDMCGVSLSVADGTGAYYCYSIMIIGCLPSFWVFLSFTYIHMVCSMPNRPKMTWTIQIFIICIYICIYLYIFFLESVKITLRFFFFESVVDKKCKA